MLFTWSKECKSGIRSDQSPEDSAGEGGGSAGSDQSPEGSAGEGGQNGTSKEIPKAAGWTDAGC